MLRRPERPVRGAFRRTSVQGPAARIAVLVILSAAVFVILRLNNQPGLAVSLYSLIPIVLGVFWFGLTGGLLTATAAMTGFFLDELLSPTPGFSRMSLFLATFNRALVFFGVAVLVDVLLGRERRLTRQLEEQRAELAELDSLRAALTPTEVPVRSGLDLATAFVPAEGAAAGDFFLVLDGPGESTVVVLGDVVGHGLEAARCAAFVRATLATLARSTSDPTTLLRLADTALSDADGPASQFVTAVCLCIAAPPHREVRWAAAGHAAPWSLDTAESLTQGGAGVPLGLGLGELTLQTGGTTLEPGSGLLVFTDGLTEGRAARRPTGAIQLFGETRARAVVRERAGAPAGEVVSALVSAVTTFAGGALADDLCVVAVRATR